MKYLFMLLVAMSCSNVFSQLSFIPQVGANTDIANNGDNWHSEIGVNAGVDALYSFNKSTDTGFGARLGIHYQQRRSYFNQFMISNKSEYIEHSYASDLSNRIKTNSLYIPLILDYGVKISEDYGLHIGIGPSLDLGLKGKWNMKAQHAIVENDLLQLGQNRIESDSDYYKNSVDRVNWGGRIHLSFVVKKISIIANYDYIHAESMINGQNNKNIQLLSFGIGYSL